MAGKNVIELTNANFDAQLLKSDVPVLEDTLVKLLESRALQSGRATQKRAALSRLNRRFTGQLVCLEPGARRL